MQCYFEPFYGDNQLHYEILKLKIHNASDGISNNQEYSFYWNLIAPSIRTNQQSWFYNSIQYAPNRDYIFPVPWQFDLIKSCEYRTFLIVDIFSSIDWPMNSKALFHNIFPFKNKIH